MDGFDPANDGSRRGLRHGMRVEGDPWGDPRLFTDVTRM